MVATLGTSLTRRGGWQEPLEIALTRCLGRPVSVQNFGGSGMSSRWGLTQIGTVLEAKPDVVTVEFSANDASVLTGFSLAESQRNAKEILRRLREGAPEAKLLLMAMNPIHGKRRWIRPWLDLYYDSYALVGAETGTPFVDFRPVWRTLGDGGRLKLWIPDGAHPKPEAAAPVIVPTLSDAIAEALDAPACRR